MRRTKLAEARRKAGLSQEALAEAVGTTQVSVSHWETGVEMPSLYYIGRLCDTLDVQDPHDLDIYTAGEDPMEITRRKAIEDFLVAAGIPFTVGATGITLIARPVAPGAFLEQCDAALKACWGLLQHAGFDDVALMLSASMPSLIPIAETPGIYQDVAASLATQAKILQGVIAMHRNNLIGREIACMEAVRFGGIASDLRMRVTALLYHGYTYVFMSPPRPDRAISIFLEALSLMQDDMPLLQSDAYSGLSNAYAQGHNQDAALAASYQAEALMPKHPERSPSYSYADHGWTEHYLWRGKAYLDLASFDNAYFQKAYDIFGLSENNKATTRSASMIAIHQANAARGLGDLGHFMELLERGAFLAIQIDSKARVHDARTVLRNAPAAWQREARLQRLSRDLVAL